MIDEYSGDVLTKNITSYYSRGGWLKRTINFNNDKKPFLFYNQCSSANASKIYEVIETYKLKRKRIFR